MFLKFFFPNVRQINLNIKRAKEREKDLGAESFFATGSLEFEIECK
jgi:hypothetical protein